MAALNDFALSLEKELTCSICQDLYHRPKALQPCLHSFCQKCLQAWNETCRNRKRRLTCPTCMTPVQLQDGDVSKLKSAFYLESLKDLLAMITKAGEKDQHNLPNCVSCEKHVSLIAFCPQCGGMVCFNCKNAHDTVKHLREEHQVKLFAELKQEHVNTYISNQQRCSEKFHENFKLEYYCKDCEKTICQKCSTTVPHSNHDKVGIEDKAEEIKRLIQQDLDRVDSQKKRFQKEQQLSKQNLTRIENEITTAKKEVDDEVEAHIKILQDHRNKINAALDEMFLKRKRENETEQREIFARIQQLDALNNQGEDLLQQNVPHFILESQFSGRFQLQNSLSILKSKFISQNTTVSYFPTSSVLQPNLGNIVERIADPSHCSVMQSFYDRSIIQYEIITKTSIDEICYTNQGFIGVNVKDANGTEIENEVTQSETGKFLVTFKAEKPPPYQIHVSIGEQEIKDSPKIFHGKIDVKPVKIFEDKELDKKMVSPFSLNVVDVTGEVLVADFQNHRILIFNADGKCIRHFNKVYLPHGVAMNDKTILVSDEPPNGGRIQAFDANGDNPRTIYQKERVVVRGMCVADQHIAVCCTHLDDKTQSGIKLLSKQSGQIIHEIPTPCKEPNYIAYGNKKYFISYYNQNQVDVYDENSALLYTFGSNGNEDVQFDKARGLAVHDDGLLFVCDAKNHRVQVLTQDGDFITSFGSHGSGTDQMNWPIDVVVTPDGKVLVLECKGSRVHVWQFTCTIN